MAIDTDRITAYMAIFVILGLFACVLVVVYLFYLYNLRSMLRNEAPYVRTYPKDIKLIRSKLNIQPWSSVIDLWCGDGKVLRNFVDEFDVSLAAWYDINSLAIALWRWFNIRWWYSDHVKLYKADFQQADLSRYDYIYTFLLTKHIANIEDWMFETMRDDAILICNSFPCKHHEPYEIIYHDDGRPKLYLYKKHA